MLKKYLLTTLTIIFYSQTNSMASLRQAAKTWAKPAILSAIAGYTSYQAKPVYCSSRPSWIYKDGPAFYRFNTKAIKAKKLIFKSFDEKRDLEFFLKCFNQNQYWLGGEKFSEYDVRSSAEYDKIIVLFEDDIPVGFGVYNIQHIY